MIIDIEGLDKAHVLAHVYHNSTNKNLDKIFGAYNQHPIMTIQDARELLKTQTKFDYLNGRLLKIDLSTDKIDSAKYDHNHGFGALHEIIQILKPRASLIAPFKERFNFKVEDQIPYPGRCQYRIDLNIAALGEVCSKQIEIEQSKDELYSALNSALYADVILELKRLIHSSRKQLLEGDFEKDPYSFANDIILALERLTKEISS